MSLSPTVLPVAAVEEKAKLAWAGKDLWSTLRFLAVPAALAMAIILFGIKLPGWALYGFGGAIGVTLFAHTLRDPEWLLACATIYLPLNMMFVVPLGFGMNATNMVLLLLLFSCFRNRSLEPTAMSGDSPARLPGTVLVSTYAGVTLMSVVTSIVTLGPDFVLDRILDVKGWLDQFIVFFTFLRLIRNGNMARRMMVYIMLSATVVVVLGFQEWLEKRGASSMEKARLLGPQIQPNDFGAFLAYASTPFLALLLANLGKLRAWLVAAPYPGISARILLATFSRGAYLGMGLAAIVATYLRGKVFIVVVAILGFTLVTIEPELVPKSMRDRMAQTSSSSSGGEELDRSAQTRLILWDAALKMTTESPIFGWGFKSFPKFKGQFTTTEVEEADNHNMYLYLSSQMGIPAVLLLGLILWRMYSLGSRIYRGGRDGFTRTIGMAAAALAGAALLVNMFGSRMVDICVTSHFWIILAMVSRLSTEIQAQQEMESA